MTCQNSFKLRRVCSQYQVYSLESNSISNFRPMVGKREQGPSSPSSKSTALSWLDMNGGLPPLASIRWQNVFALFVIPILAMTQVTSVPLTRKTLLFSLVYYVNSALGITAGWCSTG